MLHSMFDFILDLKIIQTINRKRKAFWPLLYRSFNEYFACGI